MEPIENLDDILKKLLAAIPEIKAAAIVSIEGLPIASALPQGVDETRIAAMTTALLSLAERSVIEMDKGEFDELYVKGSDGYLLILQVSLNGVLIVSTTKDVRLGFKDLSHIFFNNGSGNFPYPYIFKPPKPPDDLSVSGQVKQLIKRPSHEGKSEEEPYCKHCGAPIAEGQIVCHVCGKKVL
jgi:predicted regulator of Ras-like GTPase activity (Roadblock/LC7/MglB family)